MADDTHQDTNDGEELRAAPRIALLIRAAKLLSASGEYVVIVRDVSETGTKLQIFHELPPDSKALLELANGDRHAMERVWHADGHAGFRFTQPIDVERFMAEPGLLGRRQLRLRVASTALVLVGAVAIAARLLNISQQGACIEVDRQLPLRQPVMFEVPGLPPRTGHVRWRKGLLHGLVFQQGFRLDEFATHALAMQPFPTAPHGSEQACA